MRRGLMAAIFADKTAHLEDENEPGIPESERLFRRERKMGLLVRKEYEKAKRRADKYHAMAPGFAFFLMSGLALWFYAYKTPQPGFGGMEFSRSLLIFVMAYLIEKGYFQSGRIREKKMREARRQEAEGVYHGRFLFDDTTHGTARWLSKEERQKLLSVDNDGLVVAAGETTYESINEELSYRHIAVVAPTGTGKTQRFILPNIVKKRNASQVVTDPSGELYKLTSLYNKRQARTKVRILQPFSPKDSIFWNPLARVENISQAKRIAETVVRQIRGQNTSDPFWTQSASSLLASLIMLLKCFDEQKDRVTADEQLITDLEGEIKQLDAEIIKYPPEAFDKSRPLIHELLDKKEILEQEKEKRTVKTYLSFANVRRLMTYSNEDIKKLINKLDRSGQIIEEYMSGYGKATDNTSGGIQATLATALKIYGDEDVREVSSKHNFDFDQLRKERTTLYIVVPESKIAYASPYITLFYQQLLEYLTESDGLPVYLLMDEFGNLGNIPDFETYITTLRKRKVSCSMILQDPQQLKNIYKENWETIFNGGCYSKLYFSGLEIDVCKRLSDTLGKATIRVVNDNIGVNTNMGSGESNRGGLSSGSSTSAGNGQSYGQSYVSLERHLMTPDEIRTMSEGRGIFLCGNNHPLMVKTKPFYKTEVFTEYVFIAKKMGESGYHTASDEMSYDVADVIETDLIDLIKGE